MVQGAGLFDDYQLVSFHHFRVWISEMRGTQGLQVADGHTTTGTSHLCILFIYSECHYHLPPSDNLNHPLITPAHALLLTSQFIASKQMGKMRRA